MNKCCVRKVWSFPFPHLFIPLTDYFERFNFVSFILQDSCNLLCFPLNVCAGNWCAGDQKRLTVVLAYLSLHSKTTFNQVDYHETLTLHRNYHALFIFVSSSFFNHVTLDTMIIEQRNFDSLYIHLFKPLFLLTLHSAWRTPSGQIGAFYFFKDRLFASMIHLYQ